MTPKEQERPAARVVWNGVLTICENGGLGPPDKALNTQACRALEFTGTDGPDLGCPFVAF